MGVIAVLGLELTTEINHPKSYRLEAHQLHFQCLEIWSHILEVFGMECYSDALKTSSHFQAPIILQSQSLSQFTPTISQPHQSHVSHPSCGPTSSTLFSSLVLMTSLSPLCLLPREVNLRRVPRCSAFLHSPVNDRPFFLPEAHRWPCTTSPLLFLLGPSLLTKSP